MDREIPEHQLQPMRQMCSHVGAEPLPKKLVESYWALRYCLDRVGQQPTISDLARLCVAAGFGKPTDRELHPSVVQLYRQRKIAAGEPLLVNWRDEKVAGTLVAVDAMNRITVMVDGEERRVTADCVTLQEAA